MHHHSGHRRSTLTPTHRSAEMRGSVKPHGLAEHRDVPRHHLRRGGVSPVREQHSLDLYEVVRHTTSAVFGLSMDTGGTVAPTGVAVARSVGGLIRRGWPLCPNRPVIHDPVTGEIAPNWCNSHRCWSCIVPLTIRASEALALAKPTHWATVTGLDARRGGPHGVQATMARFTRRLRIEQPSSAWCYQVEPNPNGAGAHAHVWLRGVDVDSGVLSSAAESAGAGPHVAYGDAFARTEFFERPVITYGFKAILEARPDDYDDWWPEAIAYRALNGYRLQSHSGAFWLDATGSTCTKQDAVRAARSRRCATGAAS